MLALWGIASAAIMGMMSRYVSPSEQGQLQGANSSLMGIANMIGPVMFAQSFALFIAGGAVPYVPGAPFLLSAVMLAAAIVIAMRTTRSSAGAPSP